MATLKVSREEAASVLDDQMDAGRQILHSAKDVHIEEQSAAWKRESGNGST